MEGINIPQGSVVISFEEYNRYREIEANQDMIIVKDHYSAYEDITFIGKDEAIKKIQDAARGRVFQLETRIAEQNQEMRILDNQVSAINKKIARMSFPRRLHFLFTGKLGN